jgi:hypothetical protein
LMLDMLREGAGATRGAKAGVRATRAVAAKEARRSEGAARRRRGVREARGMRGCGWWGAKEGPGEKKLAGSTTAPDGVGSEDLARVLAGQKRRGGGCATGRGTLALLRAKPRARAAPAKFRWLWLRSARAPAPKGSSQRALPRAAPPACSFSRADACGAAAGRPSREATLNQRCPSRRPGLARRRAPATSLQQHAAPSVDAPLRLRPTPQGQLGPTPAPAQRHDSVQAGGAG